MNVYQMTRGERLDANVTPHPDGEPHLKACRECAFRAGNLQDLADDDFDWMYQQRDIGGFTFYCIHRSAGGFHRECACWAAIERGRVLHADGVLL